MSVQGNNLEQAARMDAICEANENWHRQGAIEADKEQTEASDEKEEQLQVNKGDPKSSLKRNSYYVAKKLEAIKYRM